LSPCPRRATASTCQPAALSCLPVSRQECRACPPPCSRTTGGCCGSPNVSAASRTSPASMVTECVAIRPHSSGLCERLFAAACRVVSQLRLAQDTAVLVNLQVPLRGALIRLQLRRHRVERRLIRIRAPVPDVHQA